MVKIGMMYWDAVDMGLEPRDYEIVKELPRGVKMEVVCGIWGKSANLSILFITEDGRKIRTSGFWRDGYVIRDLGRSARDLEVGEIVCLETT